MHLRREDSNPTLVSEEDEFSEFMWMGEEDLEQFDEQVRSYNLKISFLNNIF